MLQSPSTHPDVDPSIDHLAARDALSLMDEAEIMQTKSPDTHCIAEPLTLSPKIAKCRANTMNSTYVSERLGAWFRDDRHARPG